MKWAIVGILAPCAAILIGTAHRVRGSGGVSKFADKGPHGFSELLYAFTSAAANNGSAFAGPGNANTTFFNVILGFGNVDRALCGHHSGPGDRRLARHQKGDPAIGRNV